MRKIFVYFSWTGNGDVVASYLKQKDYDILKLEMVKKLPKTGFFSMMHYGRKATFHQTEVLKPYTFDSKAYDEIVIGSPVWSDRLSTPINTFLREHDLKDQKVTVILYSMGGSSKKAKVDILKDVAEANFYDLKSPSKNTEELKKIESL